MLRLYIKLIIPKFTELDLKNIERVVSRRVITREAMGEYFTPNVKIR